MKTACRIHDRVPAALFWRRVAAIDGDRVIVAIAPGDSER